jgi:aspartyl-tRNA synthetase
MHPFRTHTCGELRASHIGEEIRLSGWLQKSRDVGGILFLVIRDHYGITQVFVEPTNPFYAAVKDTRVESSIRVDGTVRPRPQGATNSRMETGDIEVLVTDFEVLAPSKILPFPIVDDPNVGESIRLEHRFLDMRRKQLHDNIVLRCNVVADVRRFLTEEGFLEITTPILTSSSPEGARDYLVPSRVHPGKFYALPQAPQQFKQLLMTSGFDRYFQIAPCFRDEDGRADRSPGEFYQIDMEMAFATQEDVFVVLEKMLHKLFTTHSSKTISSVPFQRIPYKEAMLNYGSDKPDLRFEMLISDVTETLRNSEAPVFVHGLENGGVVRAFVVQDVDDKSRKWFDGVDKYSRSLGRGGLVWLGTKADGTLRGSVKKWIDDETLSALQAALPDMAPGCVVMFFVGDEHTAASTAGFVRGHVGGLLELADPNHFEFCWIVDYPMFEMDEETGEIAFSHNPFSMPQGGLEALNTLPPLDILAYQYDIVCNGVELSSGAIRNHRPDIMVKAFDMAGYGADKVESEFGALFKAFQYGPPPHGGIAPGLDRIVMLLAGVDSIRDVIPFPMTIKAQDLLMGAPANVSQEQLEELNLESTAKDD